LNSGIVDVDDEGSDEDEETAGMEKTIKINIKEIDDMVLRDLSDALKNSLTEWPLILDTNDLAATFLRYRDTNYVNCLDMQAMQSERFRLALLGAIRYGKPFVIDLMQYDQELLETVRTVCSQISIYHPGDLFQDLCNKSILANENYLKLVNLQKDGKEYQSQYFNKIRLNNFKVIFLTSNPYPCAFLAKSTLPIQIVSSGKTDDIYDF
jgi:hypothetical protein